MSYEDYLNIKQTKKTLSNVLDLIIEGTADLPLIGNTLKGTATRLSKVITEKNNLSNSIKRPEDTSYFIILADDFYDELAIKIFKILELEKIKEKYQYSMESIHLEIFEDINEDTWEVNSYYIFISFLDNQYYNPKLEKDEYGSIVISFKEDFKQINFNDYKVYICFEIISLGGNNSFNDFFRDYMEFGRLVCYLLNKKI